jgi:hypothetical protein
VTEPNHQAKYPAGVTKHKELLREKSELKTAGEV